MREQSKMQREQKRKDDLEKREEQLIMIRNASNMSITSNASSKMASAEKPVS